MCKIAQPIREAGRNYRGFNLLAPDDRQLFQAVIATTEQRETLLVPAFTQTANA